jgi:hypothetical protein
MRVIRQQLDILSLQQSQGFVNPDQSNQGILTALLATEAKITSKVENASKALQNQSLAISQLLGSVRLAIESKAGVADLFTSSFPERLDPPPSVFMHEVDQEIRNRVDKAIINSLAYPEISLREKQIRGSYASTFEWIFKDQTGQTLYWDSFIDWLEAGSGIYWISGKAASGKSTLMRYIYQHPKMLELLQSWGGQSNVRIARFTFGIAGLLSKDHRAGSSVLFWWSVL